MDTAPTGGERSAGYARLASGRSESFDIRASGYRRVPGRAERVAVLGCGIVSIIVLIAVVAAEPRAWTPPPRPSPTAVGRGDPVLAAVLADRARAATDDRDVLRLLIAASVVAPDRAEHRLAVAGAVLGSVPPLRVNGGPLGDGVVRFGSVSAGGSWLVIDRDSGGQLWQLFATNHVLRLATGLRSPIVDASAGTHPTETRILVAYPDGVDLWEAVPIVGGGRSRTLGRIVDSADAVAVSYNAETAVTVAATTATMWDLTGGSAREVASLSYDQAVTSVALPPSSELLVAAGHADGSATVDRLDLATNSSRRRVLTGASGPIATVTLSADGAMALAVGSDGVLTVWRTGLDRSDAPTSVPAAGSARAGGAGAYRVWLSPGGTYALVAGSSTPVAVWSLADPSRPVKLRDLGIDADPAVPAMVTYDGRRIVTIDRDNVLAVWDAGVVVDTLTDPLPLACEAADLTEQSWRQIVLDPAYPNPCATSPGLPTVNVQTGPSADP